MSKKKYMHTYIRIPEKQQYNILHQFLNKNVRKSIKESVKKSIRKNNIVQPDVFTRHKCRAMLRANLEATKLIK